jgi:Ca2+-binding EF-hand superfamily protein
MDNPASKAKALYTFAEKATHLSKNLLGKSGYAAILVNLPVSLKQYEGARTSSIEVLQGASRKNSGLYTIEATRSRNDKPIHINLRGKHLDPVVDSVASGKCLKLAKLSKRGYYYECMTNGSNGTKSKKVAHGANNRSSVGIAYNNFVQQFRIAIRESERGSLKQVLMEMDEDGNSALDKHELLLGAHTLGIAITPHEMEMIWPLFGPFDPNGNIDIVRMLKLMKNKGNVSDRKTQDFAIMSLQRMNRHERIQKKTALADKLGGLTFNIRTSILAQLKKRAITGQQSFVLFDCDGNGVIDKSEFFHGLQGLGVEIDTAQMESIWPLFNLDKAGTITNSEWMKFVNSRVDWSYKLIEDRFSNVRSHIEEDHTSKAGDIHNRIFHAPKVPPRRKNPNTLAKLQRGAAGAPSSALPTKLKIRRSSVLYKQLYKQLRGEATPSKD